MNLTLVTAPTEQPVSLADAKAFLRISDTNDDAVVSSLIVAATCYCQNYLQRAIVTQQWKLTTDVFPVYSYMQFMFPWLSVQAADFAPGYAYNTYGYFNTVNYGVLNPPNVRPQTLPNWGNIVLPMPSLISVDSIQYLDISGTLQTWASTNYQVISANMPGYIKPLNSYPTPQHNTSEAVRITFTAGFGAATAVPELIKTAIKLLVSFWYEQREPGQMKQSFEIAVHNLLNQYRFWGFN